MRLGDRLLDRGWIESRIPHHGSMCLLEEVVGWDAERITCTGSSHRSAHNPLRARGRLGIACGIEYAAQTIAIHGALVAGAFGATRNAAHGAPVAGFLAGVRDVRFHASRLDDVQGDLICGAVRLAGDRGTALYEFELRCEAMRLLSGRATVVLDANERLQLV